MHLLQSAETFQLTVVEASFIIEPFGENFNSCSFFVSIEGATFRVHSSCSKVAQPLLTGSVWDQAVSVWQLSEIFQVFAIAIIKGTLKAEYFCFN